MAAYKIWLHRLTTLPMDRTAKNKGLNTVINNELNNGYTKEDIKKYKIKLNENKQSH